MIKLSRFKYWFYLKFRQKRLHARLVESLKLLMRLQENMTYMNDVGFSCRDREKKMERKVIRLQKIIARNEREAVYVRCGRRTFKINGDEPCAELHMLSGYPIRLKNEVDTF